MEETEARIYRADKQYTSILNISKWSNLACIGVLAAICLVKYFQSGTTAAAESGNTTGLLSLDTMLLISALLSAYLLYRFFSVRRTLERIQQVYLRIDGDCVAGVSLANPMSPDRAYPNGRPFTLQSYEIIDVSVREITYLKQNMAPALTIKTPEDTYVIPALCGVEDARMHLEQLMAEKG